MTLTVAFILIMISITIFFDIYLLVSRGVKNTISSVTYEACKKYPIIAAALGALLYHLVSGRL